MLQIRPLNPEDKEPLKQAIEKDEYHKSTTNVDFFYAPKSICNVYEDEEGSVFAVRGTKALRLDIQFFDNKDLRRNKKALVEGFDSFVELARDNGFTELIFNSNSPFLTAFCKKHFGFIDSQGELRKFI